MCRGGLGALSEPVPPPSPPPVLVAVSQWGPDFRPLFCLQ